MYPFSVIAVGRPWLVSVRVLGKIHKIMNDWSLYAEEKIPPIQKFLLIQML